MATATYASYFWSVLLFLLAMGAILYVLDRAWGVGMKKFFWGLTHSPTNRMPKEKQTGFIYGKHAKSRAKVAALIMLVETVLTITFTDVNPFLELITAVIDIPVLLVGFYLGPFLEGLIGMFGIVLDRVEQSEVRINSGEATLSSELRSAATTAHSAARERFSGLSAIDPVDTASQSPPTPPSAPEPPKPDPREGLDDFLGRDTKGRRNS